MLRRPVQRLNVETLPGVLSQDAIDRCELNGPRVFRRGAGRASWAARLPVPLRVPFVDEVCGAGAAFIVAVIVAVIAVVIVAVNVTALPAASLLKW